MLESEYQAKLIKKLRQLFEGCVILKNDTDYQQGIPDLSILWHNKWAFLEVKTSEDAPEEPNQRWFVQQAKILSFGAFIYPENQEEVLDDLQYAFGTKGQARRPKSQQVPLDELHSRKVRPLVHGSARRRSRQ